MSYLWSAVGRSDVKDLATRAYISLRSGGMILIHDFTVDDQLKRALECRLSSAP